jgi:hypothetical protein
VRKDVCDEYNEWVQNQFPRTVWSFCNSYYRADGQRGVINAIFPGTLTYFWWLARRAQRTDYVVVGAKEQKERGQVGNVAGVLVLFVALLWGLSRADLLPLGR